MPNNHKTTPGQDSPVRIGMIGASWFADLWYLPALAAHPQVELTAICSRDGRNAKALADKYGIPVHYSSYEDMMDNERLDGVCIITPNDIHEPAVCGALERGLHVICEKPLAIDSAQSGRMLELAERAGLIHTVNFTYRENPAVIKMRTMVQSGAIGTLLESSFVYTGEYGLGGPPGWRGSVKQGGAGGILQDLGSHLIDLAHFTTGDVIAEVQAQLTALEKGKPVPFAFRSARDQAADSAYFTARLESGAAAVFMTSWLSPQGRNGQTIVLDLHGTGGSLTLQLVEYGAELRYAPKGSAWIDETPADVPRLDRSQEPSEARFRPWRVGPKNEAWKWADAIAARKKGTETTLEWPNFRDGHRSQQVIDAVLRSAESGNAEPVR